MSCIAGLAHLRGEAVNPRSVQAMMDTMRGRAPDGAQLVHDGAVALGLLHLQTGSSAPEAQAALDADGEVWVAADARIDGRDALIERLRKHGRDVPDGAPHATLLVHAYRAFGESMLDALIGDFSFALWDRRARRLLCARDHFGVRPFHFARVGDLFAFASDADALARLPGVSRELDEASLADFLLFGSLQEPARSIFRDIACLPPAHTLVLEDGRIRQRRYWSLPQDARTRCASRDEYAHAFLQCLERAVADRLPHGPAAVQLSGGMDSSSVAALAAPWLRRAGHALVGLNASCRSLIPQDQEGEYAAAVARHLGIPLHQQDLGLHGLFDRALEPSLRTAAPLLYPKLAAYDESLALAAGSGARVLLSGHGADALLAPSQGLLATPAHWRRPMRLLADALHHVRLTRSFKAMGARSLLRRPATAQAWIPDLPDWLDPDFARRTDLPSRWARGWQTAFGATDARHQLQAPWLSRYFESAEPLKRPVQLRHPFYDLRLVTLALGLPDFMRAHKAVLREAMRDHLPADVVQRPKTGLVGDIVRLQVTNGKLNSSPAHPASAQYPWPVLRERYWGALESYVQGKGAASTWSNVLVLSPMAFKIWLSTTKEPSNDPCASAG
jgi:asparagine synthase (glutamine-hydrolysing)